MFLTLLAVTFTIALLVSAAVARLFNHPIAEILERIVSRPLSAAWHRYVRFALYVVGISGGVRIWELEKYITPRASDLPIPVLTPERWVLEVYRTVIETLQSTACVLLVVFAVALVAYAARRGSERLAHRAAGTEDPR